MRQSSSSLSSSTIPHAAAITPEGDCSVCTRTPAERSFDAILSRDNGHGTSCPSCGVPLRGHAIDYQRIKQANEPLDFRCSHTREYQQTINRGLVTV